MMNDSNEFQRLIDMSNYAAYAMIVGFALFMIGLSAAITGSDRALILPGAGIVIGLAGVCGFFAFQFRKDHLKQKMIDYANRRAQQEGTAPDFSFLYYFNSRRAGSDEQEIALYAYEQMIEWERRAGAS